MERIETWTNIVVTRDQMVELDRRTIEDIGVPGVVLMENAGQKSAEIIDEKAGGAACNVLVCCGKGNNGGDGFVISRYLHNWGYNVNIVLTSDPDKLKGDALINYKTVERLGIPVYIIRNNDEFTKIKKRISQPAIVVDALFGTGLKGEIRGIAYSVIEWINRLGDEGSLVVSVDIPSGLCCDTGRVLGVAVEADLTVTFGFSKPWQFTPQGARKGGRIYTVDISIPERLVERPFARILSEWVLSDCLKRRDPFTHKGHYGKILVVAGSRAMSGAATLVANSALRTGAGLVYLYTPLETTHTLRNLSSATITLLWEDIDVDNAILDKDVVILGPGLGQGKVQIKIVEEILEKWNGPIVVDADGLNIISKERRLIDLLKNKEKAVITPHPAEAARLLEKETKEVFMHPFAAVDELVKLTGAVTILKGTYSFISNGKDPIYINTFGNPGMATGGMGDVLSGIVGTLLHSKDGLFAALCGVIIHSKAADTAAKELGEDSLLPDDVVERIKDIIKG